jgi:hypothetical protein
MKTLRRVMWLSYYVLALQLAIIFAQKRASISIGFGTRTSPHPNSQISSSSIVVPKLSSQNSKITTQVLKPKTQIEIDIGTSFITEPFSMFKMKFAKIPPTQRSFIQERSDYFYNVLMEYSHATGGAVKFLGSITVAHYDSDYFIIDGQHRYSAYKRFYDLQKISDPSKDFKFSYFMKDCATAVDLRQSFRDINNVLAMDPNVINATFADTRETLKIYLENKYAAHIKPSASPIYPNFNVDKIIGMLLESYREMKPENCVDILEGLNDHIGKNLRLENWEDYEKAKKKQGFFLAHLMRKPKDSTDTELIKRKAIPKSKRFKLWNEKSGAVDEKSLGKCCCCDCEVSFHTFEVSHIQPVSRGGSDEISNLEVCCRTCNRSMGNMPLPDWRNYHFGLKHKGI